MTGNERFDFFYNLECKKVPGSYVFAQWLYSIYVRGEQEPLSYREFIKKFKEKGHDKKKRGYPFKIEAITDLQIDGFDATLQQVEYAKEFIVEHSSPVLEQATKILDLKPPVTIKNIGEYHDGGTLFVVLNDARDKELSVCLDGVIGSAGKGKDIYTGVVHPSHENGKKLETGDIQAKALADILYGFCALGEIKMRSRQISEMQVVRFISALRSCYGK